MASKSSRVLLTIILCDLLVLIVYIWLISIGRWTKWPTITSDYDLLATSFQHAQLSLEMKPDAALLALPNPYDPNSRLGIPYPIDISLYKGEFYLYFGPIPAILLLIVKDFIPGPIGDQYIVFAFTAGTALFQSFLIFKFWQKYFPDISLCSIGLVVLASGLICPFVWVLGTPRIYEAAIAAGQFFFLVGFYLSFSALADASLSKWKMGVIGLVWVAAIASRITLVLPIGFITILLFMGTARKFHQTGRLFSKAIPAMFPFLITLGIGLAVLGWYNWARFNSVFETGFSYALAGLDLGKYRHILFSPVYILQNVYVYLLNPPKFGYAFPYLSPIRGARISIIPSITLPSIYYTQDSTGLLYSSPFLLLAIVPLIGLFRKRTASELDQGQSVFPWLVVGLYGSFLSEFLVLAAYFWTAERFTADFIPCLTLLSILGFWQLDQLLDERPKARVLYWMVCIGLILIAVIVSSLLALSINTAGFRSLNPLLWRQLSNFFRYYLHP